MGTPCHTWHLQAETKLYRLQTPASPFFRPGHYDLVGLDEFAMGTNAVVAVISYTVSTFMTQCRIRVNGTVHVILGTAVAQWLRCCATNRKVAGLIPDGVIGILH